MTRTRLIAVVAVTLNAVSPRPAAAQTASGGLSGVVRDSSGAVVPAVAVTATHQATNAAFATDSNERGQYVIRPIPVGRYTVVAALPGFRTFQHPDVDVRVDDDVRLDVLLTVGALTETVIVRAETTPVDAATSTLKTVVDRDRIDRLPLNGRNPTQLMQLVAGVLPDATGLTSGTTYPGVQPVSSNGSRGNTTNYILDGGSNNDHYNNAPNPMPNPDALQEFSVQTNNFSAEFGRQSGGIVNAVTKSGTNAFHGNAFEYVRNNALNAANFFAPAKTGSPNQKQDDGLKRNQAGITVGGPVFLPKIYNGKDKTFFFFSYQGTRLRQRPTSSFVNVLTPQERVGDFSAYGTPLKDPTNGSVFDKNKIPDSMIFGASRYLIDHNIPGPTSGRSITTTNISDYDDKQFLAKIDQQVHSNLRLSGHAFWSRAHAPGNLTPT